MSTGPEGTDAGDAARIDGMYRAKARAEIADAESLVPGDAIVRGHGDELADVLLLKGEPGPADIEAGRALAGRDGEAAESALEALGVEGARYAACSRVGAVGEAERARRVRLLVEAIDPRLIVALDPVAAADLAAAFGVDVPAAGEVVRILGRRVLALDGLEASLGDERLKRRVWKQLKALAG